MFSQAHRTQKNLFLSAYFPACPEPVEGRKKQEPNPEAKPLPKLCYIMGCYSSSPKGTLRLETITPLCKIAPIQRSHPLPTLLPAHYESLIYLVMTLHKKNFTKKPATVVAVFLCSFFCTNHH